MLQKHWWKALSVVILLYVLVVGLTTPLSVGILSVTPNHFYTTDTVEVEAVGYNSHFDAAQQSKAWLDIEGKSICAQSIQPINATQIRFRFIIPADLPKKQNTATPTLIVSNEIDGIAVLPVAVTIVKKAATDTKKSTISKINWDCSKEGLQEVQKYDFPYRNILYESIRNLYFHVPLWFGMIFLFTASVFHSLRYLWLNGERTSAKAMLDAHAPRAAAHLADLKAAAYASAGLVYGILGISTGSVWAKFTWGQFWSFDIKQNMSAVALLIYFAYFILRASFEDEERKARLGAVYNIFAYAALIPLLFVIPRMADSLHPGNGGNPGFGGEDLDNTMRTVFYPAVIGWTLLGFWLGNLLLRVRKIEVEMAEKNSNL